MTTCPNCNKELSEDTKFCDACGTQISETVSCPDCDEQASPEAASVTETPAEEAPIEGTPAEETPVEEVPAAAAAEKKPFSKKALLFGAIGVVAVAAIAIVAFLLFSGGKGNTNYALYVKDSEIFFSNLKGGEPWEVTSRLVDADGFEDEDLSGAGYAFGLASYMSENGKYLFFPDKIGDDDNGINLYYKKVFKPKADAVKIDSDIQKYVVNDSATTVTYRKGEDGTLYQYNIAKDSKEKIASDVLNFYVSDDGKKILYRNAEGNVYLQYVGKDKEKIASEIDWFDHVSKDLSTVYYTKEDALYKQVEGKDKEKIASDVDEVIQIYDSGEIYYLTAETEEFKLMDYVIDDMKEADAAVVEPVWSDFINYPNRSDYATYEAYSDAWDEAYDRAYEAYSDAWDVYWDADSRNELRADLESETLDWTNYTLHYYNGKEDAVITDTFIGGLWDQSVAAADAPVIAYTAYDQASPEKVKLSEIDSIYDMEDTIVRILYSSSEQYITVKGDVTVLEQEKKAGFFNINDSGTSVYYFDNISDVKGYGDLYHISVSSGKVGRPEVYDTDVRTSYLYLNGDDIEYYKDVNGSVGDLYINKNKVDSDVDAYKVQVFADLDKVVYFTDWNDEKERGTLKVYDGKDSVTVADDAHTFTVTPDGKILYLYDYSLKNYKGELHQWSNGKSKKIDDDVVAVLSIVNAKYRGTY